MENCGQLTLITGYEICRRRSIVRTPRNDPETLHQITVILPIAEFKNGRQALSHIHFLFSQQELTFDYGTARTDGQAWMYAEANIDAAFRILVNNCIRAYRRHLIARWVPWLQENKSGSGNLICKSPGVPHLLHNDRSAFADLGNI